MLGDDMIFDKEELMDGSHIVVGSTLKSSMQKISKKRWELIYRAKNVIAVDACTVINNEKLSYGTKYYCVHNAIWIWTELDGKLEGNSKSKNGCPHWSAGALELMRNIKDRSEISKNLVHEHLVPRIILIDKMLGDPPKDGWTPEKIETLFEEFCIGVVVTKDEDEKLKDHKKGMPENWNWDDPWARYRGKIIVHKPKSVRWINKKIEIEDEGNSVF